MSHHNYTVLEYEDHLETRFKELEDKLSIIEKSNTESAINSAIQSITNLESKSQELEQRLFSLEGDRPTENINKNVRPIAPKQITESTTEILPSEDALREKIEEVKDESYLMEVEQSEKPKMPVTDDLFLKCLEEVVKTMVDADIKNIHQATAELLNQKSILTKSKKGEWTRTKVRDYFGSPSKVTKYIDQYRKE